MRNAAVARVLKSTVLGRKAISLKALLAVALGAMATLAIGSLGLYTERSLIREAMQHNLEHLSELAFQMRFRLDHSMFERYRDMQVASSLDTLRSGSADARRHVLERLKETYTDYAWIGLTDAQGRVLVSTGRLLEEADVAQWPWFAGGRTGPFVGDVHEALLLAELLPNRSDEPLRFVDVAAPVLAADGSLTGVLGAHLDWSWAREVLQSILGNQTTENGTEIFVLDREGRVLLGPTGSFGTASPCTITAPAVSAGRDSGTTCADGRRYTVGHSVSEGYRFYPGLGWSVLIRQPVEVALRPIVELRRELLLAGAALSVLFTIAGWILASWIARPLREIAFAADRMRRGVRGSIVPPSTRFAEAASLTDSLSTLIGEMTQTEADLRASAAEVERRQHFQGAIVENMQDALFVNKDGKIVFANSACLRLVGAASADELLGRSPFELFHSDYHELIAERIRKLSEPGIQVPTVEEKIVRFDGRDADVEVNAASFTEDGNHVVLVIMRDITARKLTERQLTHAQRMEAVGHLTGGLAHDFNNLLTVIIGNLDLLEADLKKWPRTRELAEAALQASLRGAELTRQLLAFSRRQSLNSKVIHANDRVKGTTDLLRRTLGERIEVRLNLAEDLWPAEADPTQLDSALANLAINARDGMADGGTLTIETANKQLDEQYALENMEIMPGDYVMLAVSDTGAGIPADVLPHVFEPFFTTKPDGKGSGLGLSMIYGFAKQSQGHVKIYSEVGLGTTVRLYLPRAKGDRGDAASEEVAAALAPVADATILVVEDKPDVRAVVKRQLTELGYRVLQAENPVTALSAIESEERIDLIFTDIVMPGGKTGIDLAREARELRPEIKVVFTSGFAEVVNGKGESAKALGPLLSKPYRKQDLARQIGEALR